ncbi:YtxH domain-containing protein [Paenibacillus soyae]|uniref:YtxH domain-containing protein n=1 Tax=Paenibacillus soyae TaxID=2969249 RepID=A0A9X2SCA5_9BACL|nr:YtxH domain-containing protein [Paenibacillus soyae]MCR2806543.1 YtxH domain-containing protein [Paenibacillus soyae]
MPKENSNSGVVMGAVIGGAVGAVTALLFAPKAGGQLRSDICNQLQTIGSRAKEMAGTIGTHAKELAAAVGTHAKELADNVSEQTKETGSKLQEDAADAYQSVKSDINSMAPTERDLKKLGKEMDEMPTHSELRSKGQVPDPAQ